MEQLDRMNGESIEQDNGESGDFLCVRQRFHKFYVCDSCGTECYFCVTNSFDSLPRPDRCPFAAIDEIDGVAPRWREIENTKKS